MASILKLYVLTVKIHLFMVQISFCNLGSKPVTCSKKIRSFNSLAYMHHLLKKHYWLQIALPVLLASLATWITLHPLVEVSYRTPYLMFFGVIFISSAYGGSRSSIIATVSCVLLSFLFIQPKYQPQSEIFGVANFIFLAEGLLLSGLFRRIEKIQQKLSESEQRFRGIIEKSAEGMLMTDQNGQISYLSPSVNILLGAQSGELVGTSIQSLLHPDERVENSRTNESLKSHHLLTLHGKTSEGCPAAPAGDLCAVAKLGDVKTGDTLRAVGSGL
ncbi:MAG: PAS domain S-box protein, partial [Chitinophagaceae bacterium]